MSRQENSLPIVLMAVTAVLTLDIVSMAEETKEFAVNVTSPAREGIEVKKTMLVKGTAELPPGYHLWVFVRREDFGADKVWWPQNEGRINPRTGEWKVPVYFGGEQDIDWDFDIAVAVFDMDAHHELREWLKDANEIKSWEPRLMPRTAAPPQFFKVHKKDHK